MSTLSLRPRPFQLTAIALAVLAGHAALLDWLVSHRFTPPPPLHELTVHWLPVPQPKPAPRPATAPRPPHPAPPRPAPPRTVPRPEPVRQPAPPPRKVVPPPRPVPVEPPPAAVPPAAIPEPQAPAPVVPPLAAAASSAIPTPAASDTAPPTPVPPAKPAPAVEVGPSFRAAYLDNPAPPYPRMARQLGEEGTSLLRVEVGPDGRPLQVKLQTSSGYRRLDDTAVSTVEQWRFVPATRNGKPVTAWVLVPIRFKIY